MEQGRILIFFFGSVMNEVNDLLFSRQRRISVLPYTAVVQCTLAFMRNCGDAYCSIQFRFDMLSNPSGRIHPRWPLLQNGYFTYMCIYYHTYSIRKSYGSTLPW